MEEKINKIINVLQEFEKHNEIKWDGDTIKSYNNLRVLIKASQSDITDDTLILAMAHKLNTCEDIILHSKKKK